MGNQNVVFEFHQICKPAYKLPAGCVQTSPDKFDICHVRAHIPYRRISPPPEESLAVTFTPDSKTEERNCARQGGGGRKRGRPPVYHFSRWKESARDLFLRSYRETTVRRLFIASSRSWNILIRNVARTTRLHFDAWYRIRYLGSFENIFSPARRI